MKNSLIKRMFGIDLKLIHYFAEQDEGGSASGSGSEASETTTVLGGAGGDKPAADNGGKQDEPAKQAETKTDEPPAADKSGTESPEKKDSEPKKTDEPPKATEYTDFKFPEGMTPDEKLIQGFKGLAKEMGLTQEQAQKYVDLQANSALAYAKAEQDAYVTRTNKWKAETDQYLGADKEKKLALAAKAMKASGVEKELREMFDKTGLGNHPLFVKLLVFAGGQIADDTMPGGSPGKEAKLDSVAVETAHAAEQLKKANSK
ncbi:MAG: hypothetical protein LBD46_08510 [Endomicrobium sp.]|jgi:hypothetical protein|nr:hypothetical protein [Endomicrobium sp.]